MSKNSTEIELAVGVVANSQGITFIQDGSVIPWSKIDEARNQLRFTDHVLVTITFSYGRVSDFDDSFIIERNEWKALKAEMMGRSIHFGEIAGKHSDVSLDLDTHHIKETKSMKEIVQFFNRSGWSSGNVDVRNTYQSLKDDGCYED